jgi:tetratricopeptide (TPR) repeat protein
MEKKFRRTRKALMKEYHSNSNNLQVPFYLCQLYGQHGDLKASAKWGDEYLNRKDDMGGDFNETIYFTQVRNYQAMGDYKKAQELLRMGLKDDPFNPDLGLALSDQGTFTKENALVAEGARRFLKGYSNCINKPHTMGGRFYFTLRKDAFVLMLYRLCISCLHEARDAWNLFKPNKELADPKMMEEFKSNLSSLGFNDLLAELREEDVLPLPELKSLPLAV